MAYDATIEVGVVPTLDKRKFNSALKTLEKDLRSVSSGQHTSTANMASKMMMSMIQGGMAVSPTQARMIMSDFMGGGFSSKAKGILRNAQNMAELQLRQQKSASLALTQQERRDAMIFAREKKTQAALLYKQWKVNNLSDEYEKNKDIQSWTGFSSNLTSLRKDVAKLYLDYRKEGKKVPKWLQEISKNTSALKRGAVAPTMPASTGLLATISAALGTAIAKIGQITYNTIERGIARGDKGWQEVMMYGTNIDLGLDRGYATLTQMDEKVFGDIQRKFLTYRERLKWGQVSEGERMMWSRLGLMPAVSSGEAATHPQAFMETLFSVLRQRPAEEALSALQMGGANPQLIAAAKYLGTRKPEDIQRAIAEAREQVASEIAAATQSLSTRAWWGRKGKSITANLTAAAANFIASGGSASMFSLLPNSLKGITYEKYKPENQALALGRTPTFMERAVSTPVVGPLLEGTAKKLDTIQYVTNYVTQNITGSDSQDIAEKTAEQLNMLNLNSTMTGKGQAN